MAVPFRPIALAGLLFVAFQANAAPPTEDQDWPLSSRLLDSFSAGDYARVITESPRVLRNEPHNNELRLAYANSLLWTGDAWGSAAHFRQLLGSELDTEARLGLANALAWSGRMADSIPYYESLLDGPQEKEARLGLANAQRWRGRPDLALPHYRRAIADDPASQEAATGLLFTERELRPRTVIGVERTHDNSPMDRRDVTISHTWRDSSMTRIFSVAQTFGKDWIPGLSENQRDLTVRIEDLGMVLAPRLELSHQDTPNSDTFGQLRLKLADTPFYANLGRINWGKTEFNMNALNSNLSAKLIGLEGKVQTGAGEFQGFVNYYDISDNNHIVYGDIRLTPWWRPYGSGFRPFIGVSSRNSGHQVDNYWSPTTYAVGYVGAELDWESASWNFSTFASVGTKLAGDASTYWSAGLTAKRWIGRDWAIGANIWGQDNGRSTSYKSFGMGLQLEKLW